MKKFTPLGGSFRSVQVVHAMCFHPTLPRAYLGCGSTIRGYSILQSSFVSDIHLPQRQWVVIGLEASADYLIALSNEGVFHIFEGEYRYPHQKGPLAYMGQCLVRNLLEPAKQVQFKISPLLPTCFFIGPGGKDVLCLDIPTASVLKQKYTAPGNISCIALHSFKPYLAIACAYGRVLIYDYKKEALLANVKEATKGKDVQPVELSFNRSATQVTLSVVTEGDTAFFWDIGRDGGVKFAGSMVHTKVSFAHPIGGTFLSIAPYFVTFYSDGSCRSWSLDPGSIDAVLLRSGYIDSKSRRMTVKRHQVASSQPIHTQIIMHPTLNYFVAIPKHHVGIKGQYMHLYSLSHSTEVDIPLVEHHSVPIDHYTSDSFVREFPHAMIRYVDHGQLQVHSIAEESNALFSKLPTVDMESGLPLHPYRLVVSQRSRSPQFLVFQRSYPPPARDRTGSMTYRHQNVYSYITSTQKDIPKSESGSDGAFYGYDDDHYVILHNANRSLSVYRNGLLEHSVKIPLLRIRRVFSTPLRNGNALVYFREGTRVERPMVTLSRAAESIEGEESLGFVPSKLRAMSISLDLDDYVVDVVWCPPNSFAKPHAHIYAILCHDSVRFVFVLETPTGCKQKTICTVEAQPGVQFYSALFVGFTLLVSTSLHLLAVTASGSTHPLCSLEKQPTSLSAVLDDRVLFGQPGTLYGRTQICRRSLGLLEPLLLGYLRFPKDVPYLKGAITIDTLQVLLQRYDVRRISCGLIAALSEAKFPDLALALGESMDWLGSYNKLVLALQCGDFEMGFAYLNMMHKPPALAKFTPSREELMRITLTAARVLLDAGQYSLAAQTYDLVGSLPMVGFLSWLGGHIQVLERAATLKDAKGLAKLWVERVLTLRDNSEFRKWPMKSSLKVQPWYLRVEVDPLQQVVLSKGQAKEVKSLSLGMAEEWAPVALDWNPLFVSSTKSQGVEGTTPSITSTTYYQEVSALVAREGECCGLEDYVPPKKEPSLFSTLTNAPPRLCMSLSAHVGIRSVVAEGQTSLGDSRSRIRADSLRSVMVDEDDIDDDWDITSSSMDATLDESTDSRTSTRHRRHPSPQPSGRLQQTARRLRGETRSRRPSVESRPTGMSTPQLNVRGVKKTLQATSDLPARKIFTPTMGKASYVASAVRVPPNRSHAMISRFNVAVKNMESGFLWSALVNMNAAYSLGSDEENVLRKSTIAAYRIAIKIAQRYAENEAEGGDDTLSARFLFILPFIPMFLSHRIATAIHAIEACIKCQALGPAKKLISYVKEVYSGEDEGFLRTVSDWEIACSQADESEAQLWLNDLSIYNIDGIASVLTIPQ